MTGHNGRVNHLLYPHAHRSVFDAKYILSGGVDFTVRMWDIYSGSLVHTFSAHSGAVTDIVVCPENMSVSMFVMLTRRSLDGLSSFYDSPDFRHVFAALLRITR